MKLTAQVKLLPTMEQAQWLKQTLERANALCNAMSDYAWEQQVFGAFKLQKLSYQCMRKLSGLSAQMVIRCYSKVADAYKARLAGIPVVLINPCHTHGSKSQILQRE